MASKKQTWLQKLSRLYRSGPKSKRGAKNVRGQDTTAALARNGELSIVQKSQSPSFANMTGNAYSMTERLNRYQDYSEMESTPELASALDIYADETVACDEKEQIFHIFSPSEAIKVALEDLFFGVLNVEFNLRGWVRNLVKYGDLFLLHDIDAERGVFRVSPLPVNEVEREEGYDPTDPTLYRFRMQSLGNKTLECWEVSHMRLLGNDQFLPYGMSVVESARRIWRQLILIEDAMLTYRIVRAPERRVFYVDVGNTSPEEVPLVVEEAKRNVRSAPVVDRMTGRADLRYNPVSIEEDYWVPVRGTESGTKIETLQGGQNAAATEDVQYIQKKLFAAVKIPRAYLGYDESLCLSQDTEITLLDGSRPTIQELARRKDVGQLDDTWVWSVDSTGKPVPGRVVDAWQTKIVSELWHVTLDSGRVIRCTGNHPFLCRDGVYRRADELVAGQSLMPLYRKLSSKRDGDFQDGYERVLCNATGEWKFAHRVVAAETDIEVHSSVAEERKYVIHHTDHDKLNNNPTNLLKMGRAVHALYHSSVAQNLLTRESRDKLRAVMATEEYAKKHLDGVKRAWASDDGSRRATLQVNNSRIKRTHITIEQLAAVAKKSRSVTEFFCLVASELNLSRTGATNVIKRAGFDSAQWIHDSIRGFSGMTLEELIAYCEKHDVTSAQHFRYQPAPADCEISSAQLAALLREHGYASFAAFARDKLRTNHRVVSVELVRLEQPEPVYDITVEGYHNFGVVADDNSMPSLVIVSNSSKATLAQEDIRFSRTITVIQKTVIAELTRLAVIHLFCLGFPEEQLTDFTLKLSNPSTVAQQQKLELLRARAEIAGAFPEGMVDREWIRREVLSITDEDAAQIDAKRLQERMIDAKIEAAGEPPEGGEGGGSGGGGSLFGGGAGDSGGAPSDTDDPLSAAADSAAAPADDADAGADLDAADDAADDEERDDDVALLTSGDDPAADQRDRVKRRAKRKKHHGPAALSAPDLAGAISSSGDDDPFDLHWLSAAGKSPLSEARALSRVRLAPDLKRSLMMAGESLSRLKQRQLLM